MEAKSRFQEPDKLRSHFDGANRMAEAETTLNLYIEGPDGARFQCEVPPDITVNTLVSDFSQFTEYPTRDANIRFAVDLVDPDNGGLKRLSGDQSIAQAGLLDGAVLQIHPEAIAGCFLGEVHVLLANGAGKPIRDVVVGDVLLSSQPNSSVVSTTKVAQVFTGLSPSYLTLNGSIHVTECHPIWRQSAWIRAGDLKVGDELQGVGGRAVQLTSIQWHSETVRVYNLHVESSDHTFFAADVLVHNMHAKQVLHSLLQDIDILSSASPDQQKRFAELEQNIKAVGLKIDQFDALKDRVEVLEYKLDQFAKAFELLGSHMRRVEFVPQRTASANSEVTSRTIAEVHVDADVSDFDEQEQLKLINAIAQHTHVKSDQIRLLDIQSGSVLVIFEMPEEAARRLLDLYLSGDPIITDLRIDRVELRRQIASPSVVGSAFQDQNGKSILPSGGGITSLPGSKVRNLQDAMLSAFHEEASLQRMVRTHLNENLRVIASGTSLIDIVFKLITWAESRGRLEELIVSAIKENPGNPDLKRVAQEFFQPAVDTKASEAN